MTDATAFGAVSDEELKTYMEQQATTAQEGEKAPKKVSKKKADATPGATEGAATPKPPKAKIEPHACKCGCGKMIESAANFVPGHDAKAKSLLRKANEGKLDEGETIPEILKEYASTNDKWKAWFPELFAKAE